MGPVQQNGSNHHRRWIVALFVGAGLAVEGLVEARTEGEKFRSINAILTEILIGARPEEEGHDVMASELVRQAEHAAHVLGPVRLEEDRHRARGCRPQHVQVGIPRRRIQTGRIRRVRRRPLPMPSARC